jgi:hypothetical protein
MKPKALAAWQEYIEAAASAAEKHLRPENHFLDIDDDQDSVKRVRTGEILVSPVGAEGLKKVPSGIIHDWVATAFIEHARLAEVLSVIRDYDRYKEIYQPTVIESKTLARRGLEDRFSMVLLNKSLFLNTALNSEYECSYFRVNDHRWYSISETTRIREIENYGTPDQRMLSDHQGTGLIWRLFSITRFEERDGGVYIELEAVALSRDIPISVRWIVEPIVRRISRNSLTTSLRQTEDAISAGAATASRSRPSWSCSSIKLCGYDPPKSGAAHSLR